jgi:ribosome-associated translation inhibitor RaiA
MTPSITFHNLGHSQAVEDAILRRYARLIRYADGILHCRVSVESPHHHRHRGRAYAVHIELSVPGGTIDVGNRAETATHDDIYVAIRDAFRAARRQLQSRVHVREVARRPKGYRRSARESAVTEIAVPRMRFSEP